VTDVSEQLDECIYAKTERVLHASPDDEVFDLVFLVEFQPDDNATFRSSSTRSARLTAFRSPSTSWRRTTGTTSP
jgi:hypothetical protein